MASYRHPSGLIHLCRSDPLPGDSVKLVRVLIAAIAALSAAVAVQVAATSGASATADCTACWGVSTS